MKSNIDEKIIKIEENDIQSLSITLSSNIVIRLGSNDIKEKINMFFKVYKSLNSSDDLKKIMYIDMRYSNGFSVGWK
jgi:cell division septal protein FtsQ